MVKRTIFEISGKDANTFLDNLVTCQVIGLAENEARFGALLTPQGKILFDFFLIRKGNSLIVDIASVLAEDFQKRLMFYRLRAKVEIKPLSDIPLLNITDQRDVTAKISVQDPRHPKLGWRNYGLSKSSYSSEAYTMKRLEFGVPEGGLDYEYGNAYPHETLMDQFSGVDFKKGCYVGQEVVSRMQHRGTTKKRVVKVTGKSLLPETGTEILADGKPAGKLGTCLGSHGLALVRLDRIEKASAVTVSDILLECSIPDWVSFSWPLDRS